MDLVRVLKNGEVIADGLTLYGAAEYFLDINPFFSGVRELKLSLRKRGYITLRSRTRGIIRIEWTDYDGPPR